MTDRQANALRADNAHRDQVVRGRGTVVRRRRGKKPQHVGQWVIARSRKRMLRTAAVCTGVLLLMALSLYFGLSRQDASPGAEGAARFHLVGFRGLV